jgi:hypothetical protein
MLGTDGTKDVLAKIEKERKSEREKHEVIALLNSFGVMARIRNTQNRRQYRHPWSHSSDTGRHTEEILKLMKRMDFSLIRRFNDAQLHELVSNMQIVTRKPEEFLYHKGDKALAMYFIFVGEMDLLGPGTYGNDPVQRISQGLHFGDEEPFGAKRKNSAVMQIPPISLNFYTKY